MDFILTRFPLIIIIIYLITFLFNPPWVFGSDMTVFSNLETFRYIRLLCPKRI